jgi:hypothetical protein
LGGYPSAEFDCSRCYADITGGGAGVVFVGVCAAFTQADKLTTNEVRNFNYSRKITYFYIPLNHSIGSESSLPFTKAAALRNQKLHDFHASPNTVQMGRVRGMHGEKKYRMIQ